MFTQLAATTFLLSLLLVTAARADFPWLITATDIPGAVAQSQRFTGDEGDAVIGQWFDQWKQRYNKSYTSSGREKQAKATWRQNLKEVRKHNTDDSSTSIAELNQFADLTFQQFSDAYLMKFDPIKQGPRHLREMAMQAETAQIMEPVGKLGHGGRKLQGTVLKDWRTQDKVTPVKYQGQCGSCWAFAATAAIESAYHIHQQTNATAAPINLSEQQMVSCANQAAGYYSQGCNGGCSDMAINYVYRVNQTTEARYPYTATTGTCNTMIVKGLSNLPSDGLELNGAVKYVSPKSQTYLMSAINMQPIVVYFMVTSDFYSYKSGVYQPNSGCDSSINHAMLAVGFYWSGDNATSYWILKNSWGTAWGEKGYVRIQMTGDGLGPCLLQQYPLYPVISFKYLSNLP